MAWAGASPSVRVRAASSAAEELQQLVNERQAASSNGTGSHQTSSRNVHDLQTAAQHAAGHIQELLAGESSPDVLTALTTLTEAVSAAIQQLALSPEPSSCTTPQAGTNARLQSWQSSAVSLLAAASAAQQLKPHAALLQRFARALCTAAETACARDIGSRRLHEPASQGLHGLLTAILEVLSQPPRDAFADVGGAPKGPDQGMQGVAKRWQQDSVPLLAALREVLEALAVTGSLQPLQAQREEGNQPKDSAADVAAAAAGSFWSDLKAAVGDAHEPENGLPASTLNGTDHSSGLKHRGAEAIAQQATSKPLIEVLEPGLAPIEDEDLRKGEEETVIGRGGVILEELPSNAGNNDVSESKEGASADVSRSVQPMTERQLAPVLLACALYSMDAELDAPWASAETSAAAASVLERLAGLLEPPSTGQAGKSGVSNVVMLDKWPDVY